MSEHEVRIAQPAEQDAVLDTLMLAFATDPCIRYIWRPPSQFFGASRRLAVGLGGGALANEAAYLAADGAAAALWLPPGIESDAELMGALVQDTVPADRQATMAAVVEGM